MTRRHDGDYQAVIATPLPDGVRLGLRCSGEAVVEIDFLPADAPCREAHLAVAQRAAAQLTDYFSDPGIAFDVTLAPAGTAFQHKVWRALRRIPPGQVLSYGELARRLGSGARAVASACRNNPIPLIVPCHRVVAATGVGGFMGATQGAPIAMKQWLLQHEGY